MFWARQYSMKRVGSGISLMGLIPSPIFRAAASPENAFVYIRKGRPLWVGIALRVCGLASQSTGQILASTAWAGYLASGSQAECSGGLTQLYVGAAYSFTIG